MNKLNYQINNNHLIKNMAINKNLNNKLINKKLKNKLNNINK